MYLKYLNDDNVKTAFISQIILISKLSNLNIGNFLENNDNSYSFFNLFYDRDKYKKIVLSLIDEMSNNSKDLKYTLNESAENSKKFLTHWKHICHNENRIASMIQWIATNYPKAAACRQSCRCYMFTWLSDVMVILIGKPVNGSGGG